MKNYGIKVVPIAVGRDVLLDELRKMATNPLDVQLMQYNEIGRREDLVQQLLRTLCPIESERPHRNKCNAVSEWLSK